MKTPSLKTLPLLLASLAVACTPPDLDEDDLPTGGDATDGASTGASGESGEAEGTAESGEAESSGGGSSTSGAMETGSSTDTGDTGEFACGSGRLHIGNPMGDVTVRPEDGAPAIDMTDGGPSLPARTVLASPADPSKIVITMGSELWYLDTNDSTLHHILGDFDGGLYRAGACDTARIGIVQDLAFRPDGTIYLAAHSGNGIAEVVDPFGPGCTMNYYAGTQEEVVIGSVPHEPGNQDGPAADALFAGPDWITAEGEDLYIVDTGNRAIRKIDAEDNVSTLATIPSDYNNASGGVSANGIAKLGDKFYLPVRGSVESSQNATILEVDPASGEVFEIATGRDDPWLVGSSGPDMASVVAVDDSRVATWVSGRIFTVDVETGDVVHVAGDGEAPWGIGSEFKDGYDPYGEHDALELELDKHSAATAGKSAFLAYFDGALYFTGRAEGFFTLQIDCD